MRAIIHETTHAEVWSLDEEYVNQLANDLTDILPFAHIERVAAVSHLHCGRVLVPIAGDDLAAKTHRLDYDLFTKLATSEQ